MFKKISNFSTFSENKFALLSFFISLVISITVVIHSYNYLSNFFEESKIMMLMVILTIELCYISLPYVSNISLIKNKKLDNFLIGLLFLLSIIPATLQTMVGFTGDVEKNIISEPIPPLKTGLIDAYKTEISDISKQIESNQRITEVMAGKDYLSKSQQVSKSNSKLIIKKSQLLSKITKMEEKYLNLKNDYDIRKENYDRLKTKKDFNSIFDILRLSWAFFLIAILQLINGRFIVLGNQIINQSMKKREKFDELVINTTEEEDLSILSSDYLRNTYKIKGIGDKALSQFLQKFDITSIEYLKVFVKQENREEEINSYFTTGIASKLNKLCNIIKKRNEKENKKNE